MLLGAGRDRVEQSVDHAVGAVIQARRGDKVKAGDPLVEVHYRSDARLGPALELLGAAYEIGDAPVPDKPLILETLD
jgi:thymidine phosphorylase